jgi:CubicO group peptidase (beta-lactamase class C family)
VSGIPGLSFGTSRQGARAFGGDGDQAAAGLKQYRIASLTKPFTAAAVVRALAGRGIPLSTPARRLVPALAADWRADPAIKAAARLVVRAASHQGPGEAGPTTTGTTSWPGAILEAVTGLSFEEAIQTAVLAPWGLGRTGFDLSREIDAFAT